jgi:hypothetical protein
MMILADLCSEFRDAGRAEQLYAMTLPFDGMIAAPFLATLCHGAVARALGTTARLMGAYDRAEAHFRSALDVENTLRAPPLVAATQAEYARLLMARARPGDRVHALRILGEARDIAAKLGMKRLHQVTMVDLRAAGVARGPGSVRRLL